MIKTNIGDYESLQHVSIIYLLIYLIHIKHVQFFSSISTNDYNKYWWSWNSTACEHNIFINLLINIKHVYSSISINYYNKINIGHYETIQHVSTIYILIYLIDIKLVHSFLQYQPIITTNIGNYETLQHVSIIYLLIYLTDIKNVQFFSLISTNDYNNYWWLWNYTACKYNILINCIIDIKHVHSSLQYQPMITTNIRDYQTI